MKNNIDDKKVEIMAYKFIDGIMYDLMYDDMELANISFYFKEKEARDYLKSLILKTIEKDISKKSKLYDAIENIDYSNPVLEISNYREFFYLLYLYINNISTYYDVDDYNFEFWMNTGFTLKYLWLRMTPDDFKNPEQFLYKSINILQDRTFNEFKTKEYLEDKLDDKYYISVLDRVAQSYDESAKEMLFSISDKSESITLPMVRYGIYEENGSKLCEIGSIQDKYKYLNRDDAFELNKKINRFKYKLNEGVDKELIDDIEPNKLLALLLFVKQLKDNNIDHIRIPSMYVLDYDYHEKADKRTRFEFENRWNHILLNYNPATYSIYYQTYLKTINKQDAISFAKTTGFIKLFERLIYHIDDVDVISYPMDTSSYFDFKINSYDKVKGKTIKKILK